MSARKRIGAWSFLIFLLLTALACGLPNSSPATPAPATQPAVLISPVPGATSTVQAFSGEAISGAADRLPVTNPFAHFSAVPASSLGTGFSRDDLDDLLKLASLERLSSTQRETLLQQGFVLEPRAFDTFAAAYSYGAEQKLPAFVTADVLLHTFHIVTSVAWQRSEARFLTADLQALSEAMTVASQQQWEQAEDDQIQQAALRNMAFFATGAALLNPGFVTPSPVADIVAEELTLIEQGGAFISPLFRTQIDYSRYAPRGYYTQSESLQRYFRALSWLSHSFSLAYAPSDSGAVEPLLAARMAARQALLMTWGLEQSNNLSRWERIFHPVLYFHGASKAWSVPQVQAASAVLFGQEPIVSDLSGDALVDDFLATMNNMPSSLPFPPDPAPAFVFVPGPRVPDTAQEFTTYADSAILRQLTFNRVGAYSGDPPFPRTVVQTSIGPIRGLPRTLDVPAAFGSELAQELVQQNGDANFDGYELQLTQLQEQYGALETQSWPYAFDAARLFALQPLLGEVDEDGYLYAPPEAWQARQLNAWLAAWTALRLDVELAPRPVTEATISPDVAYGYLEPQPVLYGRLASLAEQLSEGLGERDLLDEESAAKLQRLQRLLEAARAISRKELTGERLTADEAFLLRQFIPRLTALTTYDPAIGLTASLTDGPLPRLVDVALEASSGQRLQAATGEAWPIYILVPSERGPELAMGATVIAYELHGEQLSPEAWQQLETRPPPPDWLADVIAGE
ncbi:MAG: DUF3160 domain-containing protein [Chloroflexota bacterium]